MRAKRPRRTWPITLRGPQRLAGTVCATPQTLIDAEGNGEVMGADRFTDQRKDTPRRSSTPLSPRRGSPRQRAQLPLPFVTARDRSPAARKKDLVAPLFNRDS